MNLIKREQAIAELDHAALFLDARLLDAAGQRIDAALRRDPDLAQAWEAKARLQLMRGDGAGALTALDRHDLIAPQRRDAPGPAMLRAAALAACGMIAMATTRMEQLAAAFPGDAQFQRSLAGLHLGAQQNHEATAPLRAAARLSPGDHIVVRAMAQHVHDEEAIDVLMNRKDPVSRLRAARRCRAIERLADARALYDALLEEHRDDAGLWREAGEAMMQMGELSAAIARLRRSVALGGPGARGAWSALGEAHLRKGRIAEAGACWRRATRQALHAAEAWAGLVVCAQLTGRTRLQKRAEAWLSTHASRAERRKLLAKHWQAAAAAAATRPDAAHSPLQALLTESAAKLQHAAEQQPGRADAHYHLGVCREAMGESEQAQAAADTALSINRQYAAARRLSMRLKGAALRRAA